jgi:hypothetical protein
MNELLYQQKLQTRNKLLCRIVGATGLIGNNKKGHTNGSKCCVLYAQCRTSYKPVTCICKVVNVLN